MLGILLSPGDLTQKMKSCAFEKLRLSGRTPTRNRNVQDRVRYNEGTKIILVAGIKGALKLVEWLGEVTFTSHHTTFYREQGQG